jgi:hypothetical protein
MHSYLATSGEELYAGEGEGQHRPVQQVGALAIWMLGLLSWGLIIVEHLKLGT